MKDEVGRGVRRDELGGSWWISFRNFTQEAWCCVRTTNRTSHWGEHCYRTKLCHVCYCMNGKVVEETLEGGLCTIQHHWWRPVPLLLERHQRLNSHPLHTAYQWWIYWIYKAWRHCHTWRTQLKNTAAPLSHGMVNPGDQQDGDQTLIMLINHALEEAKRFSWEAWESKVG